MNPQPFSFSLRLEDFDLSRLPISADVLRADRDLLVQAVSNHYTAIFQKLGGTANVAIAEGAVHVSWYPQTGEPRDILFNHARSLLKRGNYRAAAPILHSLYARYPDDAELLYDYGTMLSDQGRLDSARSLLERLVELEPDHANGWTALGVALARSGDMPEALKAFRRALELAPANAYALRNAGAVAPLRISFGQTLALVRSLWWMVAVGEGILAADQVRALVARTLEQIAAQCLPPRRARTCARGLRQPVQSWPRLRVPSYQNGPTQQEVLPANAV